MTAISKKMPKALILAGGFGTRISEESHLRPKPMIEIGGKPILWHIMKHYYHYGVNEFIILAGYRQQLIKEYFANYFLHNSDITFDFRDGHLEQTVHRHNSEKWRVTIVDTGYSTMTGGRLKRVKNYLDRDQPFFLTYGDGVSDIDIARELEFHKSHGRAVTMAGVQPEARFGQMDLDGLQVRAFREKSRGDEGYINGGFMVLEPKVIDYINGDDTELEYRPMQQLAADGELMCYRHNGFWKCMDTLRDREALEAMWRNGNAPWKSWPD